MYLLFHSSVALIILDLVQDAVFEDTKQLAHWLGKTVCCSKDYPGFIVNRVLMPMINEAFYALYEGVSGHSPLAESIVCKSLLF